MITIVGRRSLPLFFQFSMKNRPFEHTRPKTGTLEKPFSAVFFDCHSPRWGRVVVVPCQNSSGIVHLWIMMSWRACVMASPDAAAADCWPHARTRNKVQGGDADEPKCKHERRSLARTDGHSDGTARSRWVHPDRRMGRLLRRSVTLDRCRNCLLPALHTESRHHTRTFCHARCASCDSRRPSSRHRRSRHRDGVPS
jgi:hypothetical protein